GGCASCMRRPNQIPEAQRVEERAMEESAGGKRAIEQVCDKARVAVQPAFRLDEIEEQHASERGERERVSIDPHARRPQTVGQTIEGTAKRAKEAGRHAFARKHLADTQRKGERRFTARLRQSL